MTPLPSWGDPAKVRTRGQTAAVGGPGTPDTHGAPIARGRQPPGRATSRRKREGGRGLARCSSCGGPIIAISGRAHVPSQRSRPATRRWRKCSAPSALRSVHFRIRAWVFAKLRVGTGRECQPPEPADIFDPAGSATLSRSRSKPHRKNSIVGQIWSRFPPASEMWGYAQCAVGMPEPVFTEKSEGLVYLKTLQGAFTR